MTLATGIPMFKAEDGRMLPLPILSSGTQELLPLLNVLERLATEQEDRRAFFLSSEAARSATRVIEARELVYVEEPEANVFPSTQDDLVRLFAWLSSNDNWAFDWVITTHSPYILSSFNNLLQAWQVGVASSDVTKKEVAALIDERYWIDPKDFKAYSIHDGRLESIMDEETHLINGEYLDAVSNEIGSQFDELLRIGYAKA